MPRHSHFRSWQKSDSNLENQFWNNRSKVALATKKNKLLHKSVS